MELSKDLLIEMHRRMLRIRKFDEKVEEIAAQGELPGMAHLSIGEEGFIAGSGLALEPQDYEMGTHRSHGHCIGKGAAIAPLFAELLGKVTGVNRGKSGSMHLADFSVGSLGETSIVGSGLPAAAGAALASKILGENRVTLCYFGDGASNQGTFHESLNMAAIWKLPVIYFCENNGYAISTPASYSVAVKDIADRAKAYDIPGVIVDGQDPVAVYEVTREAVERARAGEGPTLIEAKTYRFRGHAAGMPMVGQPEEEINHWMSERDPIKNFRAKLIKMGLITEEEANGLEMEIQKEVDDAYVYAKESPYPDASEAYEGIFSNPVLS